MLAPSHLVRVWSYAASFFQNVKFSTHFILAALTLVSLVHSVTEIMSMFLFMCVLLARLNKKNTDKRLNNQIHGILQETSVP